MSSKLRSGSKTRLSSCGLGAAIAAVFVCALLMIVKGPWLEPTNVGMYLEHRLEALRQMGTMIPTSQQAREAPHYPENQSEARSHVSSSLANKPLEPFDEALLLRLVLAANGTTGNAAAITSATKSKAKAKPNPIGLYCTSNNTITQAEAFLALDQEQLSCPGRTWLQRLRDASPEGSKVVVDVGSGFGYEAAALVDLWAPELGMNKSALSRQYAGMLSQGGSLPVLRAPLKEAVQCGRCKDCGNEDFTAPSMDGPRFCNMTVYSFEISLLRSKLLQLVRRRLLRGYINKRVGSASAAWFIHNTAVSSTLGWLNMTGMCSKPPCRQAAPSDTTHQVQVTTLDVIADLKRLRTIHLLQIHTGGNEPDVLFGARQLLKDKMVDVLSFEYVRGAGDWRRHTLHTIVEFLEATGYACYMNGGSDLMFKLSGECWDTAYAQAQRATVVCARHHHHMAATLDQMTSMMLRSDMQRKAQGKARRVSLRALV